MKLKKIKKSKIDNRVLYANKISKQDQIIDIGKIITRREAEDQSDNEKAIYLFA